MGNIIFNVSKGYLEFEQYSEMYDFLERVKNSNNWIIKDTLILIEPTKKRVHVIPLYDLKEDYYFAVNDILKEIGNVIYKE